MAKTNIRGGQIADGSNGVDLTVDVFNVLPVAQGGTGVANPTAGRFMVGNGTSVIDLSKLVPAGAVVGDTDAQTLTNKTLTAPKVDVLDDTNGHAALSLLANAGTAVNYLEARNAIAGSDVELAVVGSDTDRNLKITPKGVGQVYLGGFGLNYGGVNMLGAWQTWVPVWTGLTVNNGTVNARYITIGKTIIFEVVLVFGSSTTVSGGVNFTLPVASKSASANHYAEAMVLSSGGSVAWGGKLFIAQNATNAYPYISASATNTQLANFGSFSLTMGTSSQVIAFGAYETN